MIKQVFLFSFLVFLISCDKDEIAINNNICSETEYKIEFNIQLDEEVCFPDDNSMIFKNAEHHLCPCEVDCDAEGDLLIVLETVTVYNNFTAGSTKEFYTRAFEKDNSIFTNHQITAFSYTYGNEDEEVPACAADFEPEKMKLTFIISSK